MEWWAIVAGVGVLVAAFVKKLNSLVTLHVEWGLVRLEFARPGLESKKPIEPKAPRQLKQARQIPRGP